MLDVLAPVAAGFNLSVPSEIRRPIAIVGAGMIVDVAHLPAYRKAGLEVVGIYDKDAGRAKETAQRHGVPRVYASLEELLTDPNSEIVDIAVHPAAQPEIAFRALEAGKHLLCQKPFALSHAAGLRVVEEAERRGLKVAVNQQLRYDEGIAIARCMVEQQWIGEPLQAFFNINILTDWSLWPWLEKEERLEMQYHSLHYVDAARAFMGTPRLVWGSGARIPGQTAIGETRTISVLVYPGERRALIQSTHASQWGDPSATFRIEGTDGAIRGTLGLLYDYPRGRPDTLEVNSRKLPTDGWLSYPVTQRWLPDGVVGPMKSLMEAIASGTSPDPSGRDNLDTLRVLEGLYESMKTGQSVELKS
jgi:predicted dehydrogenase